MSDVLTIQAVEKRINTLMKCIITSECVRNQNQLSIKQIKTKLNDSFENINKSLKLKQNELNEQIDCLSFKCNDQILVNEYEVHQLLGNLATFMIIANTTKENNLFFLPKSLDLQIEQINQQIAGLEGKTEMQQMLNKIQDTLNNIEKSFNVFDNEKRKLNKLITEKTVSNNYQEWLYKPKVIETNKCDFVDLSELINKDSDSIEILADTSNENYNCLSINDDDNTDDDESLMDKSTWLINKSLESSTWIVNKSLQSSTLNNSIDRNTSDDGVSKIWNSIASKPINYWLNK